MDFKVKMQWGGNREEIDRNDRYIEEISVVEILISNRKYGQIDCFFQVEKIIESTKEIM
jgi:hypothetical protein